VLPRVPAVLVMFLLAIAAVSLFGLGERGVALVGVLPRGFPPRVVPHVGLSDLGALAAGARGPS
jgi:MFS superfamily sulfate permease-like transporter